MKLITTILLAILLSATSFQLTAQEIKAKVVKVIDGDTFDCIIANDSLRTRIRLWCIDTPERGQSGYHEAKNSLYELVTKDSVTLRLYGKEKYHRTLAEVFVGQENVNKLLVINGFAVRWKGCKDETYKHLK